MKKKLKELQKRVHILETDLNHERLKSKNLEERISALEKENTEQAKLVLSNLKLITRTLKINIEGFDSIRDGYKNLYSNEFGED